MILQTKPPPPAVGPSSAGIRLTPIEFDHLDDFDENYRYELINGVLVVTPPPSEGERGPIFLLGHWLLNYQESLPEDSPTIATLPEHTIVTEMNRRRADCVIWTDVPRESNPKHTLPTIAIEFVSEGKRDHQRDYVEKLQEYLAAGIREYWIIDRFRRTMTVYTGTPDDSHERIVEENETYTTDLLPGFELPLAKLLAAADQWTKEQ